MSQGNVPISLLLDGVLGQPSANRPQNSQSPPISSQPTPLTEARPVHNLISQYQAFVGMGQVPANQRVSANEVIVIPDDERIVQHPPPHPGAASTSIASVPAASAHGSSAPIVDLQHHVKNFQALFQYDSTSHSQIPLPYAPVAEKPTPKPIKSATFTMHNALSSRTSINSLINSEESPIPPSGPSPAVSTGGQTEKKKRANQKVDGPNKKPKLEPAKKGLKMDVKAETKKGGKGKKKTPEVAISTEKPAIHPTMTTDKVKAGQNAVKLAAPTFMEAKKDTSEGLETTNNDTTVPSKDKESGKEKEKPAEIPVIALEIPLLDPKNPQPGQAEVVVNVLRLAEDKYGWNVIHPNAKSAIDLMDEILDDDDDGDDDEDDDLQVVEDKLNPQQKKKEELTEEQLVKKHQTRMNRKVGKYDYEDPFIDDAELQWEEEITTTKEGFFVYWGPLVDDKSTSASSAKKSGGKGKK